MTPFDSIKNITPEYQDMRGYKCNVYFFALRLYIYWKMKIKNEVV